MLRDNIFGVELVYWVGGSILGCEGGIGLNLDRLGESIMAAIEEV